MTPQVLDKKIVSLLEDRLKDEYKAHYHYQAASNWCKNLGYSGGEKFFLKESTDELAHARKLQDYLSDWNVIPNLTSIEKPKVDFKNLYELVCMSYELELDLYKKYNSTSADVLPLDPSVFTFLDDFREIQTSSVAEYATLINKMDLIDSTDKFQVFYFDQTVLANG